MAHTFREYDETACWASVGLPDPGVWFVGFGGPVAALRRGHISFVGTRHQAGAALALNDFIKLPDDARHAGVDAAVVVAVGERGMEAVATRVWSPVLVGIAGSASRDKDAFEADALTIGIDDFLQYAHDTRVVDQEFGRTGHWGAVVLG